MVDILKNLNLLDKLVIEHGGSVIFKNHIALLKEQILIIDSEKKDLQISAKDLQIKINDLEKDINVANERNESLKKRLDEIHSVTLSEKHEKVLIAVASYSGHHSAALAQVTGMSEQETTSKLNYLSSMGLLHYQTGGLKDPNEPRSFPKAVSIWFVSKPGHAYIRAHNLNDKIT